MKILKRLIYFAPFLILGILPLACSSTFTIGPSSSTTSMATSTPTFTPIPACAIGTSPTCTPTYTLTATFTGTSTNTSTATATPTYTNTLTNTPNVPPTATVTPNGTTIPMGPVVVGAFDGSIINVAGYTVTVSGSEVGLSYNRLADTTASVTLITPSNGSIPLTWTQDINMGTYTLSQYSSGTQFIYTPNAVYSIAVYDTWGNAFSTMNAPGQITFNANGSSVTALYPGNDDQAQVQESAPVPQTIFVSPAGVNVGSPYNYPVTAYPNSPASYTTTYSAGLTITTFTGSPGAWGYFVGNQSLSLSFTR